ncbi:MAG TPA: hypothetical protein PL196_00020 [Burkholderiaceae bacterium]|nr:hypothetical protein [Burkholderiaceae bacterium]
MSSCLLALLTGCAAPQATVPEIPASLDRPCRPGPDIPGGDTELRTLFEVWAQREAAARECRALVDALRAGWPK